MPKSDRYVLKLVSCAGVLSFAALVCAAENGPAATGNVCEILNSADIAPLVGATIGKPSTFQNIRTCRWKSADSKSELKLETKPFSGNPASYFQGIGLGARTTDGAIVKDEPGIGDYAYSVLYTKPRQYLPDEGVDFGIIKDHVLIYVTYGVKGQGVEKMRDAVRPIAKKIASANL